MDNIILLRKDLINKSYRHGGYQSFRVTDLKVRDIHKASVRDRLLHHAIYRVLYPYFDCKFIYDSYSCRIGKGTHKAMNRFRRFGWIVSKNNTRTAWVLKCDIRKFFANIDHKTMLTILAKHIGDKDVLWVLAQTIESFHTKDKTEIGLPLGNLTSQLLINIYMNEFDHFVKRNLKTRYYIRYADDFVFLSDNKDYLENLLPKLSDFLQNKLKLTIHPDKIFLKTLASGIDFLGWVHFPDHRVVRRSTKRRVIRHLSDNLKEETHQSYLGLLEHGNAEKIEQILEEIYQRY